VPDPCCAEGLAPRRRRLAPRVWIVLLMPWLAACEGLIYHPQPMTQREAQVVRARHPQVEELRVVAADGVHLRGWVARDPGPAPRTLVIYFGGNAEEVSWMLDFRGAFTGWDLALVNYRGYGLSEGRPSERALFADAVTIHDHLAGTRGAQAGPVVAFGRSLGSAVAVHLASRRPLRGVILVAPFDSVGAVARGVVPFLPTGLLLGEVFDSLALAPSVTAPLGMIVAERDEVIPNEHSTRLFDAWAGPKERVTIRGAGHNDLQSYRGYWRAIEDFLAGWRGAIANPPG